ncbi:MAG: hypothetical protein HKN03_18560 [Acidimicrobiales bacterium]|nr:hypothetical protein [Acidimicrobiales bacterium]
MFNPEEEPIQPDPLDADLDDVADVFPDGEEVHTPPSEADAPAPPG